MKRKREPVSQQENRARYKQEDMKLGQMIEDWENSVDWDQEVVDHPQEIIEIREKMKQLTPALQELKRDAPLIKRKHEASQAQEPPSTTWPEGKVLTSH